jgi:hypothetical protein
MLTGAGKRSIEGSEGPPWGWAIREFHPVRACPTCECFVPAAASRCPRCDAALEPIEVGAPAYAEPAHDDRELLLVGAGTRTASGSADPITHSIVARVSLPPLGGPAGLPRRPCLPKLPQPFAPDPLVLAVFLGIPLRDSLAAVEGPPDAPARTGGLASLKLPADAFGALLGIPHDKPATNGAGDELLPSARGTEAALVAAPAPAQPAEPVVVAVPLAAAPATAAIPAVASLQPLPRPPRLRRPRFTRRDPFARRATRRERFLARVCMTLALTLAVVVLALRLPLGSRPQLGASTDGVGFSVVSAPETPTTAPFADAIRVQTRADLRVVVATAARVYPVWQSYVPATPGVLARALPQFGFVTGARASGNMSEMSVAATGRQIVIAEFAGPGGCAFARVIGRHSAEFATSTTTASCQASSPPAHGWIPLGREG